MKNRTDEFFGAFLREDAGKVLRRSILEPDELLAFRPWLFRLTDLFNLCAVFAMALFSWGGLLTVALPVALILPAVYAMLLFWLRRQEATEQTVRWEFLQVVLLCTLWVLAYVAIVREPLGTLVSLCNLTFVTFSIIGIAPWAGLLVLTISLGGLYWLRLLQEALQMPVALLAYPLNVVSAGGVGWLFLVLFFATTFIANLVWRQKERRRAALRSLEEANTRLLAAERARNEFLSAVTHELRTPLVAIHGYTDLLLMGAGKEQASLNTIKRSATRLHRLIEELLDVAAPFHLASRLRIEAVNLHEVICEEVEALRAHATCCQVAFEVGENISCLVRADRMRIGQVIANLLDNALKYSPPGSTILVGLLPENEAGYARFWVEDRGMGISEEVLPHIFDPFYSKPSSQGTPGIGLGLTICREIVTALDGAISVESQVGQGSRFTIRLPLERMGIPSLPSTPACVPRALVLDDETDVLNLMKETLTTYGFSVDAARNGTVALEMASQQAYDLILLDINVPGLTGVEVSRRLRGANRPGKILLFSALIRYDADSIITESLADGFMPKPFTLEILERRLRELGFVL